MKTGIFYEVGANGQFLSYLLEDNWKELVHERAKQNESMFVPEYFTDIYDKWTGYFVEPLHLHMQSMIQQHQPHWDAHYILGAVGGRNVLREASIIQFHNNDWYMAVLSGEEFYKSWANKVGSFYVPAMTLDSLFESLGKHPDLLRIDIEGLEYETLLNYSFYPSPKIIQVDYHGNLSPVQEILETHNYRIITDKFVPVIGAKDYDVYAELKIGDK